MSRGRDALIERRALLVARADAQRDDLTRGLQRTVARVDHALSWVSAAMRSVPVLGIGVGLLAVMAASRRRKVPRRRRHGGSPAWRIARSALSLILHG